MDKAKMHDLKPDRVDLSAPLPPIMMAIPALFIGSVLAAGGLGTWFTIKKTQAQEGERRQQSITAEVNQKVTQVNAQYKDLEIKELAAQDVIKWVQSTQPVMDIVATVVSSMRPGATLASMKLKRSPDNSEHIDMQLAINNDGQGQKEEIAQALTGANYQIFKESTSSVGDSTRLGGDLSWTCTLVRNKDEAFAAEQP